MTSNPDVVRLAEELRSAVSLFVRRVRSDTRTPRTSQSDTLELLERHGRASIATIAQRRNVKHQSMRQTLRLLEEQGLASREDDPSDGRIQLFTITDAGRAALATSREARVAWIAGLMDEKLTEHDHAQVAAAAALLRRLIEPADPPG